MHRTIVLQPCLSDHRPPAAQAGNRPRTLLTACRCQAVPQKVSYQLYAYNDAHTIAYVITGWYYRGTLSYKITWQVVKTAGRWLVEDSWCTGRHTSTLYTSSIPPCS